MISVEQTVGVVGWNVSYNMDRFTLQRNVNTATLQTEHFACHCSPYYKRQADLQDCKGSRFD